MILHHFCTTWRTNSKAIARVVVGLRDIGQRDDINIGAKNCNIDITHDMYTF